MMNYRDDQEYLKDVKHCQALEVEAAQITSDLDAMYLAYLRGYSFPMSGKMERAEMIAKRSALRLDIKLIGGRINEHKDRVRNKRHEDLLGELKNVLNENGLGHYVQLAFNRASGILQTQGESHEFQT